MNGEILDTSEIKSDDVLETTHLQKMAKRYIKRFSNVVKRSAPQSFKIYHNSIAFTGYDLKNIFNKDESEFNLTRIFNRVRRFTCVYLRRLNSIYCRFLNIAPNLMWKYSSFDAALRNAPFMVKLMLFRRNGRSKVLNHC